MPNLANVQLMGHIVKDPELKHTQSGTAYVNMAVAVNRFWKQNGEKKKDVSFFNVTLWAKTAENTAKYMRKGGAVYVEGELIQDRWETEDGQKRSKVKVNGARVQFLASKKKSEGQDPDEGFDENEGSQEPSGEEGGDVPF